ncbi:MAG: hypothetical protein JST40_00645 [Armatimonadetes bacterium]|nr:hypothetical protein [Armatimonadota bacterium]
MNETVTRAEFDQLRKEIADLRKLLGQLKTQEPEIDQETIQILAASVAAYLGKRATIRMVRRVSGVTEPWRTEGRVSIAASHQMKTLRGW